MNQGDSFYTSHLENIVHDENTKINSPVELLGPLELSFREWYKKHEFPLMTIRYETLNQYYESIESFLDLKINWEPWIPRKTKWVDHKLSNDLELKSLDFRLSIDNADSIKIW